jgi:DNA-binding MarR family transcriptional regulator
VTRLYFALMRLARVVRRAGDVGPMPPARLSALATLAAHGPMRPGDLAAREQISPPTLSRTLAALADAGLIGRTHDPADQRASLLTVTPAGQEVLALVRAARTRALQARLEQLDGPDQARVLSAVDGLERMAGDTGRAGASRR